MSISRRNFLKSSGLISLLGVVSTAKAEEKHIYEYKQVQRTPNLKKTLLELTNNPYFVDSLAEIQEIGNEITYGHYPGNFGNPMYMKHYHKLDELWKPHSEFVGRIVITDTMSLIKEKYNVPIITKPHVVTDDNKYDSYTVSSWRADSRSELEYSLFDNVGWKIVVDTICLHRDYCIERLDDNMMRGFNYECLSGIKKPLCITFPKPIRFNYFLDCSCIQTYMNMNYEITYK